MCIRDRPQLLWALCPRVSPFSQGRIPSQYPILTLPLEGTHNCPVPSGPCPESLSSSLGASSGTGRVPKVTPCCVLRACGCCATRDARECDYSWFWVPLDTSEDLSISKMRTNNNLTFVLEMLQYQMCREAFRIEVPNVVWLLLSVGQWTLPVSGIMAIPCG